MPKFNISPPPIREVIVDKVGIATRALIRYLIDIRSVVNGLRETIYNVSESYTATIENQVIICDATLGDINITLPPASSCYANKKTLTFAIYKKDITTNKVVILPDSTELIAGETLQELLVDGEVLNFITDGFDWYLGA